MTTDKVAKNLLQDKTCDTCKFHTEDYVEGTTFRCCCSRGRGVKTDEELKELAKENTCGHWIKGVSRLRIYGNGNVGIGTATPSAKLHIKTASGAEMLIDDDGDVEFKFN